MHKNYNKIVLKPKAIEIQFYYASFIRTNLAQNGFKYTVNNIQYRSEEVFCKIYFKQPRHAAANRLYNPVCMKSCIQV